MTQIHDYYTDLCDTPEILKSRSLVFWSFRQVFPEHARELSNVLADPCCKIRKLLLRSLHTLSFEYITSRQIMACTQTL